MRVNLIKYENKRISVTGEIVKINRAAKTICIKNIMYNDKKLTSHIWIRFSDLTNKKAKVIYGGIHVKIKFSGVVSTYIKKSGLDYCFTNIIVNKIGGNKNEDNN